MHSSYMKNTPRIRSVRQGFVASTKDVTKDNNTGNHWTAATTFLQLVNYKIMHDAEDTKKKK